MSVGGHVTLDMLNAATCWTRWTRWTCQLSSRERYDILLNSKLSVTNAERLSPFHMTPWGQWHGKRVERQWDVSVEMRENTQIPFSRGVFLTAVIEYMCILITLSWNLSNKSRHVSSSHRKYLVSPGAMHTCFHCDQLSHVYCLFINGCYHLSLPSCKRCIHWHVAWVESLKHTSTAHFPVMRV